MDEMEDSFMVAKATLGRATWLGRLDPSAQWALHVNALTYHIGEVFHQCPKGQSLRQPLCFFFHKLEASQAEWSVFDRELYECVESIMHFRFILKDQSFTIFTDHKPLVGALPQVSNSWTALQCRHLAHIAEYSADIQHMTGQAKHDS
jgi:hypothetical protein